MNETLKAIPKQSFGEGIARLVAMMDSANKLNAAVLCKNTAQVIHYGGVCTALFEEIRVIERIGVQRNADYGVKITDAEAMVCELINDESSKQIATMVSIAAQIGEAAALLGNICRKSTIEDAGVKYNDTPVSLLSTAATAHKLH